MFDGFDLRKIDIDGVNLRVRFGGEGPPILLIHGHPRTHTTWHRVAARLVQAGYSVVCPDMRGYGQSDKPPTDANHVPYSKRVVAAELVALMKALGHERFAVVGHDRGAYVAYRMALDHPRVASHLVVLDGVPIGEALARCNAQFAQSWWHWFFFAQPDKPERAINADPEAWYRFDVELMGAENRADVLDAVKNPDTVKAMLEDYRAGLGVDRDADDADRAAGEKIICPTLFLWSSRDDMEDLYGDPLEVWGPWTTDLEGGTIASGHHMAEEAPEELSERIVRFLGDHP